MQSKFAEQIGRFAAAVNEQIARADGERLKLAEVSTVLGPGGVTLFDSVALNPPGCDQGTRSLLSDVEGALSTKMRAFEADVHGRQRQLTDAIVRTETRAQHHFTVFRRCLAV